MAAESGDPGPGHQHAELLDPLRTTTVAETTPGKAEPRPLPSFPVLPAGMVGLDVLSIQARYSSVPMPDHEGLRHLQVLYPRAAEVIFGQMVAQSNHRIEMEKAVTTTNNTLALRGQIIGALIGGIGLIGSVAAIMMGHDAAGATVATGCVLGLASIFVLGKNSQQKELAAKAETRDKIAKGEPPEKVEQAKTETTKKAKQPPKSQNKNQSKK